MKQRDKDSQVPERIRLREFESAVALRGVRSVPFQRKKSEAIGIKAPHESGEVAHALADAGAPSNPRIGLKALIASGVAAALWLIFYGLVWAGYIDV